MKKVWTLKKALALVCSASLAISLEACGSSSSPNNDSSKGEEKSVTLKLSDQNVEGGIINLWLNDFAELVKEKSGGTVEIQIYANNSLSSSDLEAAQSGVADFVQKPPSTATDLDPRCGAFDAPFVYEDLNHIEATFDFDSAPMQSFNEVLKESNLVFLGALHSGNRQLTCNKPIYTPEDLSGVKIRVVSSDLYISLLTAMGATAVPMAWSEVVTSLLTNVVDGQENPVLVAIDYNLYEVQDYMMLTNHMPTNSGLFMNYGVWSSLSENQQNAIVEAMQESRRTYDAYAADFNIQALEELKNEHGMTIIDEDSGLDVAAFRAAGEQVKEEFADSWGDMVDLIKNVPH